MSLEKCTFKQKEFYYNPSTYMPEFQRSMFQEEDSDRSAWWNIKPGDVVVDAGAGTGSWALPAAAMGGYVICFECDQFRANALKTNVSCNKEMNVVTESRGLYSRECDLGMDVNSSSVMLQLGYNPQQRVKMTTLDKWWSDIEKGNLDWGNEETGLDRLDWLKIDVEGAELHVLAGATETIKKYKPKIIVECHTFIVPGIDGMVLSHMNRLELDYKCISVLRRSAPGAIDLRSYSYPRLFFELEIE